MPDPINVSTNNLTNPGGGPLFIPRDIMTHSISLTCIVTLHSLVDIPVNVSYRWTGTNFTKHSAESIEHNSTKSSNTITINALTVEDAGAYSCKVDVNSINPFIDGTGSNMSTTNVALCKLLESYMPNSRL